MLNKKVATGDEKKVNEVNSGMYCFESKDLFDALYKITNNNAQGEYYLTDTISVFKGRGKKFFAFFG
ncbi:MAG: hypothetical protein L6V93_11735 [Clostridiales bacterium]|nr:MAG: hypothetical protein L6V93_11735 [Clostridiales bacterium]